MPATATKLAFESYLNFNGQCREAFGFYQSIFGGDLQMLTYGESPMCDKMPEEQRAHIANARLQVGNVAIMASDVPFDYEKPQGYRVCIALTDAAEAERIFAALGAGGTVDMPLDTTFWSPKFGMLTDRYGIGWMINTQPA